MRRLLIVILLASAPSRCDDFGLLELQVSWPSDVTASPVRY